MASLAGVIVAVMVSAAAVAAVEVPPGPAPDEHAALHVAAGVELTTMAAAAGVGASSAASAVTDIPEEELVDVTDHTIISGRTCIAQVCAAACKRAGHAAARCRGGCQCRDRRPGKARHNSRHSRTDDDEPGNSNNNYNVNYNVNALVPIPVPWGGGGASPYMFGYGYGGMPPPQQPGARPMYPMYPQPGPPGMYPPSAFGQGVPPGPVPPGAPGLPGGTPGGTPPTATPLIAAAALAPLAPTATSTALPSTHAVAADMFKAHTPASQPQPLVPMQPLVPAPPPPLQPLAAAQPPAPVQPLGSGPAPFEPPAAERPAYAMAGNVQPPQMLGAAAPASIPKQPPYPVVSFGGGPLPFSALVSTDRTPHWGGEASDGEPSLSERGRPVPGGGLINLPGIINNPSMPAVAAAASGFRPSPFKAKPDSTPGGGGAFRPPWQGGRR